MTGNTDLNATTD